MVWPVSQVVGLPGSVFHARDSRSLLLTPEGWVAGAARFHLPGKHAILESVYFVQIFILGSSDISNSYPVQRVVGSRAWWVQPWATCGCGAHSRVWGRVAARVLPTGVASRVESRPGQLCSARLERKDGVEGGDRRGAQQGGVAAGRNLCSLSNLPSHFLKRIRL